MDKRRKNCTNTENMPKGRRSNYVDRGTDAGGLSSEPVFQPILPSKEDLVIYFKEESSDILLDSAVYTFRKDRYPQLSHSPTASEVEDSSQSSPSTPRQNPRQLFSQDGQQPVYVGTNGVRLASPSDDDYDPFAYTQSTGQSLKLTVFESTAPITQPGAPAKTTATLHSPMEAEYKVHELIVTSAQTAVSTQNLLRSILSEYFPPDSQCFHPFQVSLLPEFDELWKPMFRGKDPRGPWKFTNERWL